MFRVLYIIFFSFALLFSSCEKSNFLDLKGDKNEVYEKSKYFNYDDCPICEDSYYQIISEVEGHKVYYVENIEYSEACSCVVKGWVKYVNGKTEAMVDYGNGDCTNWAYKVICESGDCDKAISTTCKFKLGCYGDL